MPLPWMDWASIPPQGNEFFRNFGDTLSKSMLFPQEFMQKALETQKQQALLPYVAKQAQEDYLKSKLGNQKSIAESPYWAPNAKAKLGLTQAQADQINYKLNHPGYMGGDDAKTIQFLIDSGAIKVDNNGKILPSPENTQNGNVANVSENNNQPNSGNTVNNTLDFSPLKTGNKLVDAIFNRKFAASAYQQLMAKGYNWAHLPVEVRNTLVAQGYGMGIDPIKMQNYINEGLDISQIAKREGLDPDNLPPPIYPPTAGTKTRVQQVEQVTQELDYLSSATTPLIKQYADTFVGFSRERITDMMSNDEKAQRRLGRYVGALSLQSGLNNGRVLAEGGRSGYEIMRMLKDSSLAGIDQHSPIKMSKIAYEEAQKTIDRILQKGAKIRINTGMNPFRKIGKKENESLPKALETENPKNAPSKSSNNKKVVKIVRDANGKLTFSK